MKKKIVLRSLFILSLLLIGFVVWFLIPFSALGAMVLSDHFTLDTTAKSQVNEYVGKTYGEKMEIKNETFNKERIVNTLVVSMYHKENEKSYTLYYDLVDDTILFDEFQLEEQGVNYVSPILSSVEEKPRRKELVKMIKKQERIIEIYEKELKEAELQMDSKRSILALHMEAEYERLGVLLNDLDSVDVEEENG